MTAIARYKNSILLIYGLPVLVILFSVSVAFSPLITAHPELAVGVTYDLTLAAPLLYLFLIRKREIPKITVVPFFVGGITLASFILPVEEQFHLNIVKRWILPFVEVGILTYVGFSAYKTVKLYKTVKGKNTDVYTVLRLTCQNIIKKFVSPQLLVNRVLVQTGRKALNIQWYANIIAFEVAVFYYGLLGWKKPKLKDSQFTYHKKSGVLALLITIMFLITAETIVLHIVVEQWSNILAWILTVPSIYFVFQIFAHFKAIYQRPIEIIGSKLFIRYGLFGDAEIDLDNIEKIKLSSSEPEKQEGVKQLAMLRGFEQFNTQVELKNEETLMGFYGFKSKYKTILFFADEAEKLKKLIERNDSC